ncbi:MAG: hypothetical protein IJX19_09575 [Clostridia bacterium]|nr:hypothetical protein [Clostridia bacterium]
MKKSVLRILAACLALLLCVPLFSCSKKGKTLLTLKKDGVKVTFSVKEYELMLTRVKGALAASQFSVNDEAFWEQSDKYDGSNFQTLNNYYKESILDNCRTYLVALYLFERDNLKLSDEAIQSVEDKMAELVRVDGQGSKTKLNSLLSTYGVNYDILKEAYLMQEKIAAWKDYKYGKNAEQLGKNIKEEYLLENYAHFQQIFLPAYTFAYETDANGDDIYYYDDKSDNPGHICYDVHNGVAATDQDGKPLLDENGDQIYYVKNSDGKKIAYNTAKGQRTFAKNTNGSYKIEALDFDALEVLSEKVEDLMKDLKDSTYAEFEEVMRKEIESANEDHPSDSQVPDYLDGFYIKKALDYASAGEDTAYLDEIVEKLETVNDGEIFMVKSTEGYHIIKKYPHTEKAYEKEENADWFGDFNSLLIEKLFDEECRSHFGDIKLNEKQWKKTPDMVDVGVNYYY